MVVARRSPAAPSERRCVGLHGVEMWSGSGEMFGMGGGRMSDREGGRGMRGRSYVVQPNDSSKSNAGGIGHFSVSVASH